MATKKKTFFNAPWNERSALEKGAIVIGGTIVAWNVWKYIIKPQISNAAAATNPAYPPLTTITGGYSAPAPGSTTPTPTTTAPAYQYDPRPLVDKIAEHIIGTNLYIYPEIVNQLSKLTKPELQTAYNYWAQIYQPETGKSLTEYIEDEWNSSSYYTAAIGALKGAGLYESGMNQTLVNVSNAVGKLRAFGMY
jgi:hypothetical protein